MRASNSFIDICIISQREKTKDPKSYLEKVEQIFTHMMPMDRAVFVDTTGRDHIRLECRRDQDFTTFVDKWSSFFDRLLLEIPNTLRNSPLERGPQQNASPLKNEVFLVLKIQTNLTKLVNYLLNLANGIYPLLGLNIFYESVADGLVSYIQNKSDFDGFLRPLSNEKAVRDYYQKLGVKSDEFLTQRGKILKNEAR